MTQICSTRRLNAEEFSFLARGESCSQYRPRSEVMRMLAVGEAWGLCGSHGEPLAAQVLLPLNSNTSLAAALREYLHWDAVHGGCIITQPVACQAQENISDLFRAGLKRAVKLARGGTVWAVLECTARAEPYAQLYLKQGFALRAVRPLDSLAPCYLFEHKNCPENAERVWIPLADMAGLSVLLARGWAAVDSRQTPQGMALGLCR